MGRRPTYTRTLDCPVSGTSQGHPSQTLRHEAVAWSGRYFIAGFRFVT
jgi:hypothetical protein